MLFPCYFLRVTVSLFNSPTLVFLKDSPLLLLLNVSVFVIFDSIFRILRLRVSVEALLGISEVQLDDPFLEVPASVCRPFSSDDCRCY